MSKLMKASLSFFFCLLDPIRFLYVVSTLTRFSVTNVGEAWPIFSGKGRTLHKDLNCNKKCLTRKIEIVIFSHGLFVDWFAQFSLWMIIVT